MPLARLKRGRRLACCLPLLLLLLLRLWALHMRRVARGSEVLAWSWQGEPPLLLMVHRLLRERGREGE